MSMLPLCTAASRYGYTAGSPTELWTIDAGWLAEHPAEAEALARAIAPERRASQAYLLRTADHETHAAWLEGGVHPRGTRARGDADAHRMAASKARARLADLLEANA